MLLWMIWLNVDKNHRDPFDRMLIAQALVEGVP
jgi:PIN domain nuclease of toxin-antitoxin system